MKKVIVFLMVFILLLTGCDQQIENNQTNDLDKIEKSENITSQEVKIEKQLWVSSFELTQEYMIDITNLYNGETSSLNGMELLNQLIPDKDLLNVLEERGYIINTAAPSGDYLLLELPQDYEKYREYDILTDAQKKFTDIDKYMSFGYGKQYYNVVYSLKEKEVIHLSDVKNDNDLEYIYGWLLDEYHFYISSLDTIKYVDNDGHNDYIEYHNYDEDKIIVLKKYRDNQEKEKTVTIIFYDLINESELQYFEITDKYPIAYWEVTQWNDDGTVLLTVNYTSYEYNINTEELRVLGEFMFYPLLTEDNKYMIYAEQFGPSGRLPWDDLSYNVIEGIYAKDLETNEIIFIKEIEGYTCDRLDIVPINQYSN